ncbi:iron reductase [Infundibulicybe gibba]|nr:iron reductase [Infundibulicybe gibba]
MSDTGTPPVIPAEFQQYNSYVVDPEWQVKFSIIWASCVGAAVLFAAPHLIRSIRSGRAFVDLFGISENLDSKRYEPIMTSEKEVRHRRSRLTGILSTIGSCVLWSPPGIELNVGQLFIVAAYIATVLVCIVKDAPLVDNSNRAGFLAIAQLPVVFLFATKNSVLSLLLGPGNGYEKLNYIHRWSGRCMFLGGVLHGSLWINNHLVWDLPILGQQKETSGVAALGLLCVIVLSSLKPVRKWCYQVFFIIHTLSFVAFFITICYHTIYAPPWIFPPLAFYGLDIFMRMVRFRIKDARLVPVNNQMTLIHIPDCDGGWTGGQHIRLRVFFSGRIFESHPLTIMSAHPSISCLSSPGVTLGARVVGDWTRALNEYARAEVECMKLDEKEETSCQGARSEVAVQVMMDGPYGGCSIDLGRYETVLLFAGGSGATFTIGLLDDIVGRCVRLGRSNGEKTRRIQFAWCVRSFGSIDWFAPALMDIANRAAGSSVDLHISIYVTCLCNPDAVPPIPNCDVTIVRPSIHALLNNILTPPPPSGTKRDSASISSEADESVDTNVTNKLRWVGLGGGVGVCASGPESMTREASNAVARLGLTRGMELGGIDLHTELFSM